MSLPPSRQQDQFIVRLPDGMRDRIRLAAEANNRSMNAEIVATLAEKYPPPVTDEAMFRVIEQMYSVPGEEVRAFVLDYLRSQGRLSKEDEAALGLSDRPKR